MINFFILNGDRKRTCTSVDVDKAAQILTLMFPTNQGYIVNNNKVVFAHNMSLDEANEAAGLRVEEEVPQSMTVLPLAVPKAKAVKAVKAVKAKKTKLKSKVKVVVLKNNRKPVAKKTVVKVKPKVKAKAKKPVAKVKAKAKKGKK